MSDEARDSGHGDPRTEGVRGVRGLARAMSVVGRRSIEGFQSAGRSRVWRGALGVIVPVALLGAAYVALRGQEELNFFVLLDKAKAAPLPVVLALVMSVAGTVFMTSLLFWLLIQRHGKVGFWEMACLTQSSALLNYLPMRPGMVGRVGYHKLVNGITVRDSIKVLLWANVLIVLASLILLGVCMACAMVLRGDSVVFALVALATIPAFAAFGWYARRARPAADPQIFRPIYGMAIRFIELHIWAVRFWAAFSIVGVEIGWGAALILAAGHTVALMIPISGNGLGFSEWFLGVGLMLMPMSLSVVSVGTMEPGLAAGLVARGFEAVTLVPLGLAGGYFVHRRVGEARREGRGTGSDGVDSAASVGSGAEKGIEQARDDATA
ncbi:MAG: hypothetical protein ACTS3F_09740 [Phycisphaerales bacterium]